MKTLIKRSLLSVIAVTLVSSFSQTVLAQDMSMTVTADNTINVYLSTDDAVLGSNVLGPGTDWALTDTSSPNLAAGVVNFIHVVADNTGGPAMFLGEFTLLGNTFEFANGTASLLTNTTDWAVSSTDFTAPTYVAPSDLGPNDGTSVTWAAGYGHPDDLTTIDATAIFIWHPSGDGTTPSYFSAAIVPVLVDINIQSTENSPDPVIAGSGPDNLSYTFTVINDGANDATGVVADFTVNIGGGVVISTCTPLVDTGTLTDLNWDIGNLASGGTATASFDLDCTVDASSLHNSTYEVVLDLTSVDQVDTDSTNDSSSQDSTIIRLAIFEITKIWDGGEVDVTLTCSDGAVVSTTTSGLIAQLDHTGFADGVDCVVTETVPAGFAPSYSADLPRLLPASRSPRISVMAAPTMSM